MFQMSFTASSDVTILWEKWETKEAWRKLANFPQIKKEYGWRNSGTLGSSGTNFVEL